MFCCSHYKLRYGVKFVYVLGRGAHRLIVFINKKNESEVKAEKIATSKTFFQLLFVYYFLNLLVILFTETKITPKIPAITPSITAARTAGINVYVVEGGTIPNFKTA